MVGWGVEAQEREFGNREHQLMEIDIGVEISTATLYVYNPTMNNCKSHCFNKIF